MREEHLGSGLAADLRRGGFREKTCVKAKESCFPLLLVVSLSPPLSTAFADHVRVFE